MASFAPRPLPTFRIVRGASGTLRLTFKDPDGAVEDLSLGVLTVSIRFSDSAGTLLTRTEGVGSEARFVTDGSDGMIEFLISQAESLAMAVGRGDMEVIYERSDTTPLTREVIARGLFVVEDPDTGAF